MQSIYFRTTLKAYPLIRHKVRYEMASLEEKKEGLRQYSVKSLSK